LKKKARTVKLRLMETMENSAPKTLGVFPGSHSLCYWLKKSKNKKQTGSFFYLQGLTPT
jgi:hypothetical protein